MAGQLGDKIRGLRKERGLTLDELVKATNSLISKSYLWELENRESQSPSAEKLQAIADALGVSADYFLDNDIRAPEEKHIDEAFFRGYKSLEANDKEQLRRILDTFKKK